MRAVNAAAAAVLTPQPLPFQRLTEEENMLAPSLQQFSLRTEMLPSYIPVRVAEKILFVGESVQMFENHNHSPSRAGEGRSRRAHSAALNENIDMYTQQATWRRRALVLRAAAPTLATPGHCCLLLHRLHPQAPGGRLRPGAVQAEAAAALQPRGL